MTSTPSLPSVFVPHGAGPAFFMSGPLGQLFRPMAGFLASVDGLLPARPRAILVITAHWEADIITVTAAPKPTLIYDYSGFPAETYQLSYDAPGAPELAAAVAEHLRQADIKAVIDPGRGWDHGVFIPLKVMYPAADIPVVAMSLQAGLDPEVHAMIGAALRPLREEGVLIVGSGMSYHNMNQPDGALASSQFHQWLDTALGGDAGQRRSRLARWAQAPSARASHPREEHLMPLMVCSAAGGDAPGRKLWDGSVGGTPVAAWAFA
jgi:aromatic ring-opening dioxygenase catalytic subunit (LigB family)